MMQKQNCRKVARDILILGASNVLNWVNGRGEGTNYFPVTAASTTTAPILAAPVAAYSSMTVTGFVNGAVTAVSLRDPDGTTRAFQVFESTLVLRLSLLTDRNGSTVSYGRDGQGRLTRIQDVHGRYFNIVYGGRGYVATLTESGGRSTSYDYDAQGRQACMTNALNQTKTSRYDTKENLTQTTNAGGQVSAYTNDSLNRLPRQIQTLPGPVLGPTTR